MNKSLILSYDVCRRCLFGSHPFRRHAFVSKYYEVNPNEIRDMIKISMNSEFRSGGDDNSITVKVCNLCDKQNKTNMDNLWKLKIHEDGSYHCFRCDSHGSWYDLKKKVGKPGMPTRTVTAMELIPSKKSGEDSSQIPSDQETLFQYSKNLEKRPKVASPKTTEARTYLTKNRGLNLTIAKKYGVGWSEQKFQNDAEEWVNELCITFPWIIPKQEVTTNDKSTSSSSSSNFLMQIDRTVAAEAATEASTSPASSVGQSVTVAGAGIDGLDEVIAAELAVDSSRFVITRVKHRSISTKGKQRLLPKGGVWGFFGWHLVRGSDTSVIITEGEYDAMAAAQALSKLSDTHELRHVPAISLPNGCNSLPSELVALLEKFSKIYLWMDDDEPGRAAAEKFVKKLGRKRCVVVRPLNNSASNKDVPRPKDANDALRSGVNIPDMLLKAQFIPHHGVVTFNSLRTEVLDAILYPRKRFGAELSSLRKLTNMTEGFGKGEMVVLTGNTGAGKTTILSQISLDLAKQGRPVLWGSFEIPNHALIRKMLHQFARKPLTHFSHEDLHRAADSFADLPLVFLKFYGGTHIDEVMDAIDFAVYQYDIQHIIIDNLQFMLPVQGQGNSNSNSSYESYSKFDAQDTVVRKLRHFATDKEVCMFLVVHPRKESEEQQLELASVFGSVKVTQEADKVLILQRRGDNTVLSVKKNRQTGVLGRVPLTYSMETGAFFEAP